jgi:16S rRNA U1498 N3-methylase RsmE
MDRFFVEGGRLGPGEQVEIEGPEAHHLRVKRLRPGARVRLFDGRGAEALAEVEAVSRSGARLRVVEGAVPAAAPRVAVAVGL